MIRLPDNSCSDLRRLEKCDKQTNMGDIDAAVKALKAGVDVLKVRAQVVSCTPVLFSPCESHSFFMQRQIKSIERSGGGSFQ